jgi:hypothetical protein
MRKVVGLLGLLLFVGIGAIGAVRIWSLAGSAYDALTFPAHIQTGITPRLRASDAYRITLDYLGRTSAAAQPGTVVPPSIRVIWAVAADQAAGLDGCIPTGRGRGIVWVTMGAGSYLNLEAHPWSRPSQPGDTAARRACSDPAAGGTLVIDDATGEILGVYPDAGARAPHPSPQVSPPAG